MYLREGNRDPATLDREAQMLTLMEALGRGLDAAPSLRDAHDRLHLAGHLVWRGRYRRVLDLIQTLDTVAFPEEIRMQASQIIADAHFRHDQYDLAERQYQENLERARELGSDYWTARAKDGLGWVLVEVGHFSSGEFANASQIFEETIPIYRRLGKKIGEAMGLQGLSRAVAGTGDYDLAIRYAKQAIEILQASGDERLLQLPLIQIAMVYRDNGNFEVSKKYFELAADAADRSQDPYSQAAIAMGYGCLYHFMGDDEASRQLLESVQPMIAELEFPRLGHETNRRLALLAEARKDFEEAYRRQTLSQEYGNRIGVISPVLHNQQMLLRAHLDRVGQLEDALHHLTAGIEASADAVFVLGFPSNALERNDLVIHFLNLAASKLIQRLPIQVMQTRLRETWRSQVADQLLDLSSEVFGDGQPRCIDPIELDFPDCSGRWFSVKVVKIANGVAWTISDVTEREAMEREIRSANERLIALDREKSEMLGMAAHDLRSPIANIYSLCELIPEQEPETQELLNLISGISHSLLALLSNLLDVHRIEQGDLNLQIEPVNVCEALDQVMREMSARAAQKGIEIRLLQSEAFALADRPSLLQVFENLLSNALKFSASDSMIEVAIGTCEKHVRVEVRDQGPGISSGDQLKLFGRFVRLSGRPTAGEPSTGLGLSIVKRLVEAMGGEIGCDSELGSGATFWFKLPRSDR